MDYGYYQPMQELIKAANKALSRNVSDNIKLTYNAFTGKVTVQIKNGFSLLQLNRYRSYLVLEEKTL